MCAYLSYIPCNYFCKYILSIANFYLSNNKIKLFYCVDILSFVVSICSRMVSKINRHCANYHLAIENKKGQQEHKQSNRCVIVNEIRLGKKKRKNHK